MQAQLFSDGASRGNPGPSALGFLIKNDSGQVIKTGKQVIGQTTNNIAEYQALIAGLKAAVDLGVSHLEAFADSELMVKQIQGIYKVKKEHIKPLFAEVKSLTSEFLEFKISHIRREFNKEADALANQALDEPAHETL